MKRPPLTPRAVLQFQKIELEMELHEPGSSDLFVETVDDALDQIYHSPGIQTPRHTTSDILKRKVRSARAGQYHVLFLDETPNAVFYFLHVNADEKAHMTAFDVERDLG